MHKKSGHSCFNSFFKEYQAVKLAHIDALPTNREKEKARASLREPLPQCSEDAVRYTYYQLSVNQPYLFHV